MRPMTWRLAPAALCGVQPAMIVRRAVSLLTVRGSLHFAANFLGVLSAQAPQTSQNSTGSLWVMAMASLCC